MRSVLLLNGTMEVLDVITWQKAMSLEFRGKVRVHEVSEDVVMAGGVAWELPSIVALSEAVYIPLKKRVGINKRNVALRDNYHCQYCDKRLTNGSATIDHVIPLSRGGKNEWNNVVLACKSCNNGKDNRTPSEAKMRLKRKPFTPTRGLFFLSFVRRPEYASWLPYFRESIRQSEVN